MKRILLVLVVGLFCGRGYGQERPSLPIIFFCGIKMNEKYSSLPVDSLEKLTKESLKFYFPASYDCKVVSYTFAIIPVDTSKRFYTESIRGDSLSEFDIKLLKRCQPGDYVLITEIKVAPDYHTYNGFAFPISKTSKNKKR